ncbi:hypothetical protein PAXRUDRAFT_157996, partial [Paxillus rubicundulus Ve08.2h10]
PCDVNSTFLPPGTPAPPIEPKTPTDWTPFCDHIKFETTEFLYKHNQMSTKDINILLSLWGATVVKHGDNPPFADHKDLYDTIDSFVLGDNKLQSFKVQYTGERPSTNPPPWMDATYDVWFRDPHLSACNILGNPSVAHELNL